MTGYKTRQSLNLGNNMYLPFVAMYMGGNLILSRG